MARSHQSKGIWGNEFVAIEGLEGLLDAFDKTAATMTDKRKVIAAALRKGAKIVQKRAEETAPVDKHRLESRRAALFNFFPGLDHSSAEAGTLRTLIGVAVKDQSAAGTEVWVGIRDTGFYGKFSEYGTAHQPKRPWLGPAFDQTEHQAFESIEADLGKAIEEAF